MTTTIHPQITPTRLDVEALVDSLVRAWNAGDPRGVAATFAADGRLIDPFGREWYGLDAVTTAYVTNFDGVLAGSSTAVEIDSVRELAPGLTIADCWQTITGPLPRMHLTVMVRGSGGEAAFVEARPYVLLDLDSTGH